MQINWKDVRFLVLLVGTLGVTSTRGLGGRAWSGGEETQKWQTTHEAAQPEDYAGSEACAHCHAAQFEKQKTTDMAQAAMRPAESRIFREHPVLSFAWGPYNYSLTNQGGRVSFSVSDSHDKITEPVVLAFGAGSGHQNYLIQHRGEYYQVPVSYYSSTGKLEIASPASAVPASLEAALGDPFTTDSVRDCFRCHRPVQLIGDSLDKDLAVPGVTCEACHGPGAKHVAAMKAGKGHASLIFNPAQLKPEEQLDFCGACHHSVQGVKNGELRGLRTVLSQPYRLAESRCWNPDDLRSRCMFCHDVHQPLVQETTAYDARCLACHACRTGTPSRADQPGQPCPVGKRDCAGCHMPKVAIPESHASYTDHRIRAVQAGAPYPE